MTTKLIKSILWILCVAILLWIAISFIDIVADNNSINPQHYDWNFFVWGDKYLF